MKTSNLVINEKIASQNHGKQKTPKVSTEGSLTKFYVHKTKNKNSSFIYS